MFTVHCKNDEVLEADPLWVFGHNLGLTAEKTRELWIKASKYPVLFSDCTEGKFEPFYWTLNNPVSIWFEVRSAENGADPLGLLYLTDVHPGIDATAHFTFWDKRVAGREPLILFVAEWIMDRFNLMRIGTAVPPYQKGVVRFVKRLGFVQEGVARDATLYDGKAWPLIMFGMTRQDLDSAIRRLY